MFSKVFKKLFYKKSTSDSIIPNQEDEVLFDNIPPLVVEEVGDGEVISVNDPDQKNIIQDMNVDGDMDVDGVIENIITESSSDDKSQTIKEFTQEIPDEQHIEESEEPKIKGVDILGNKFESWDLTRFLDHNYEQQGRFDGYNIHNQEFLKKKKMSLISEFQKLIEKRVDELKEEKLSCKNIIIDLKDLSPQILEKFTNRIELCDDYIEDLHNEKVMSNSGGGLIRGPLVDYEIGWDRGVSDYLMDAHFLLPIKRL